MECLDEVREHLSLAGQVLLFLDFDGTLAPIVRDPSAATVPKSVVDVLKALDQVDSVSIALVSGRTIEDLQTRIPLTNAWYAGNHGLEIHGPRLHFLAPAAVHAREIVSRLCRDLRTALARFSGVYVEDKALTASVHYRTAPAPSRDDIRRIVQARVGAHVGFTVKEGNRAYEIFPAGNWGKGAAVRWIREAIKGSPETRQAAISIGDDHTDEDAFTALPNEITVRVGRAEQTSARYRAKGPREVHRFLRWIAEAVTPTDKRDGVSSD
jgi:trehalose 6-phosphate phosphatase